MLPAQPAPLATTNLVAAPIVHVAPGHVVAQPVLQQQAAVVATATSPMPPPALSVQPAAVNVATSPHAPLAPVASAQQASVAPPELLEPAAPPVPPPVSTASIGEPLLPVDFLFGMFGTLLCCVLLICCSFVNFCFFQPSAIPRLLAVTDCVSTLQSLVQPFHHWLPRIARLELRRSRRLWKLAKVKD